MTKSTNKKRITFLDILIILIIMTGIGVISYPFVSDSFASFHNQEIIDKYQQIESKKNRARIKREFNELVQKNKEIAQKGALPGLQAFNKAVTDRDQDIKNANKSQQESTIAELDIPSIRASLPVFDHTTDWLLQYGACLLDGSSYPTGGKGTHAVISAHRGVPNAMLFTHLPKVKKGDKFFIKIGDKTLAYKVFRKKVIEPTDGEDLRIDPNQDLVTLLTCTPYMINSHRLLVTGRRVPFTKADEASMALARLFNKLKIFAWALIILGLLGYMWHLLQALVIGRNKYHLNFQLVDSQEMILVGNIFKVFKRKLFGRKAEVDSIQLDLNGTVDQKFVGGKYFLVDENGRKVKFKVRKYRDRNFTFKQNKFYGVLDVKSETEELVKLVRK